MAHFLKNVTKTSQLTFEKREKKVHFLTLNIWPHFVKHQLKWKSTILQSETLIFIPNNLIKKYKSNKNKYNKDYKVHSLEHILPYYTNHQ